MPRLATYLLYGVFLLATAEIACRALLSLPFVETGAAAGTDFGWRRVWLRAHRRGMEIAYRFDVHDPTKGWASRPGVRDMTAFDDEIVNTNSRGLRGTTDHAYERRDRRPRIVTLGDSFTFGDEVSDDETYSNYLQAMMPNVEVLNMGVHGYGHDQMLILFEEEGVKYRPDIVILGFLHTDMSRNLLRFRDYAKPRFVLDGPRLRLVGSPVPSPEEVVRWDTWRPAVLDMASVIAQRLHAVTGREQAEKERLTARILTRLLERIDAIGGLPLVAYFPLRAEVGSAAELTEGERYLFAFCRDNGHVRCMSTRPDLVRAARTSIGPLYEKRGHWSPIGNRVVAKALRKHLRKHVR